MAVHQGESALQGERGLTIPVAHEGAVPLDPHRGTERRKQREAGCILAQENACASGSFFFMPRALGARQPAARGRPRGT